VLGALPGGSEGALAYSPDGGCLAGSLLPPPGTPGSQLAVWGAVGLRELGRWRNERGHRRTGWSGLPALALGPTRVVAGSHDGTVKVWRRDGPPRPEATWPVPGGPVESVALSDDEGLVAAGTWGGQVSVLGGRDGKRVAELPAHRHRVTSVAFADRGRLPVTASLDGTVVLYRREAGSYREVLTLPCPQGPVVAARLGADLRTLHVLTQDALAVRAWHLDLLWQRLARLGLAW
jgi:WD40 repeat protein